MPSIDVTDVILSPDVASEPFEVVRRLSVVNADGKVVVTPTTIGGMVGGIASVGEQSLLREEAFQTQMNTIQVITMFPLRGASREAGPGAEYQPDLVRWPAVTGGYYLVRSINDFTSYGAGFVVAECIQFDWVDEPPPPG